MSQPKNIHAYRLAQALRVGTEAWLLIDGVMGESDRHEKVTIVKHGRDSNGPYTRVRLADGGEQDVHRARLSKA